MYVSRADRYYDSSRALSSVKPRWFFNILAYIEQVLTKDEWNPIKVKANNMNSWAILKHYCTIDDLSCVPDLLHLLTRWTKDRLPFSSSMNACGTFGLRFLSSNNLEIRIEQWNWKVSAQPWLTMYWRFQMTFRNLFQRGVAGAFPCMTYLFIFELEDLERLMSRLHCTATKREDHSFLWSWKKRPLSHGAR